MMDFGEMMDAETFSLMLIGVGAKFPCNFEILSILSPTKCGLTPPVASGRSVAIGRTVTHRVPGD